MNNNQINKSLFRRLKKLTKEELLIQAQSYKVGNIVYSNKNFQKDYNTILLELKNRKLLKR